MNSGGKAKLTIMKLALCGYSPAKIVAISTNNWPKPVLALVNHRIRFLN